MTQPAFLAAPQPDRDPTLTQVRSLLGRRRSVLGVLTTCVLGAGALIVAAVLLVSGGPVGAVVSTALAAVSFPLLILLVFWLDRYEPEPGRYRLAALGWGAVVAVTFSFVAEGLVFALPGTDEFIDTAVSAPLVEETGKGLFLVAVLIWRRRQLHGLLDGIVYAALVGIGFAFVEDIVYYTGSLREGGTAELGAVFILRGLMSPFAHPLFTTATGIGIGIAATTARPPVRVFAPIAGFLVAVMLHGLWNGSTFFGARGYLTTYAAIMLPLVLIALAVAIWARSREGRMLATALGEISAYGWIPPDAVRWVARLSDRMSARGYARIHGGPPAVLAVRGYQQTMTEVAFLHARALRGQAPADLHQRLGELLQRAAALQPYLIWPPPLR